MKIIETFHRARFRRAVQAMRDTAPLLPGQGRFVALSMVHHRDVLPYLLALKSFARYLCPARVVMVADPTIDVADRSLLRQHVPHIEIVDAEAFRSPETPVGGCWERLNAIAHFATDAYVIQLDADTVALGPLDDVARAISDGVSFTLGTEDVQPIQLCAEIAAWAASRRDGNDHVQLLAECALGDFDPDGRYRYARGCAGFAGFAAGSIDAERVTAISHRMRSLMGENWAKWGTEQFTSNLIVCSSPGARLLPHPTYCAPTRRKAHTVFLHFIGYTRFRDGLYGDLAKQVARELSVPMPS